MDVFAKVRPGGLYLLDEPEAPLSPKRQIALLQLLIRTSRAGAQFIIATHSPILFACPGAKIYSFDQNPIAEVAYAELEHVALMRDFLNDPGRYIAE
jgi:predicted ATPase